jgi:hypothetical protein
MKLYVFQIPRTLNHDDILKPSGLLTFDLLALRALNHYQLNTLTLINLAGKLTS